MQIIANHAINCNSVMLDRSLIIENVTMVKVVVINFVLDKLTPI